MSAVLEEARAVEFDVTHDTNYRYASEVSLAHHVAYLKPAETRHQRVEHFVLKVTPKPIVERTIRDVYGNVRMYFSVDLPHTRLMVRAKSRVRVSARYEGYDPSVSAPWADVVERLVYRSNGPRLRQNEFAFPSPYIPRHRELGAYAQGSFKADRPIAEAAIDLMRRIHADFKYASDSTDVSTPVLDAFVARQGVCQDFAHIMIGSLRALGLSARYVSGYLLTQPPPGKPRLVGADASHAWVSVWCPHADGEGCWLDLDPTNDVIPATSHVTLAIGRDFGDVSPLRGILRGGGGEHRLTVGVTVQPVGEI